MFSSFSHFSREILSQARREALLLKHDFIGSEHLLLSLCRHPHSPLGEMLSNLVKSPDSLKKISEDVESLMPLYRVMPGDGKDGGEVLPFSPEGKKTLERSVEIALEEGKTEIGPEHLLLSILRGPSSIAKMALEHLGVTWKKVEMERKNPMKKESPTSHHPTSTCSAGRRISEYILVEKIGEGGFGEVWKAKHHIFANQLVALKILKPRESRKNLEREGLIQNKLYHLLKSKGLESGMVELKGFDPYGEPPYIIMEYVEGLSLRKYIEKKKRLPLSSVMSVFEKILDVLEVAHSHGLVHGDLKPENILVAPLEEIKLVDFGVARSVEKGFSEKESVERGGLFASLGSSSTLSMEGTLQYMAPEQKQAQAPLTPRSDIYSLGILLYEMLLGELPQGGESPRTFLPHLPEFIDEVYKQCYTHENLRFADGRTLKKQWILEKRIWEIKERGRETGGREEEPSYSLTKNLIHPDQPFLCPRCGQGISAESTFMFCVPQNQFTCSKCGHRAPLQEFYPSGIPSYGPTFLKEPHHRDRKPLKKATQSPAKGSQKQERRKDEPRPAGLAIRGLAFCLDGLVLILAFSFFLYSLFFQLKTVPTLSSILGLFLGFCALYFILLTSAFGGTLGKLALGLKVVDKKGKKLHLGDSLIRFIGYFFSLFLFGFGFYIIFFHPKKRGLHDYFGYSWVIRED